MQKGRRSLAAGHVEELLPRLEDDLVVEVDLVGARARAGLRDRIHGVIPARTLLEASPVRRPAEIRRVDVGGESLLEAMQLIGTAEVHLAAEHGLVAGAAQIVRESRHLRGKFRGVVVRADRGNLAAARGRKSARARTAGCCSKTNRTPRRPRPARRCAASWRRGCRRREAPAPSVDRPSRSGNWVGPTSDSPGLGLSGGFRDFNRNMRQ